MSTLTETKMERHVLYINWYEFFNLSIINIKGVTADTAPPCFRAYAKNVAIRVQVMQSAGGKIC